MNPANIRPRFLRHNAKCKRCGAGHSILAASTSEVAAMPANASIGRMLLGPFAAVLVDVDGFKHLGHPNGGVARLCSCGAGLALQAVRGVLAPEHKCDARCTNALGHDCECACGGKNHGAAHSAAA